MPIKTRHYGLEAFSFGDYYSAAADQRRFTAIDSQLGLISDVIGPGRILGWAIETVDVGPPVTMQVTAGMGIIGRTVFLSYGDLEFNMLASQTKYVYMKKKTDESGGFSAPSNIDSVTASDSTPPAAASNLTEIPSLIFYDQTAFEWDENSEIDFSHYIVTRVADPEYGIGDVVIETTDTSFIDTGLTQDTFYTYEVISVDLSGNESISSSIVISTIVDTREPLPPLFFQVFIGNESIQAIWDHSPSDYVEYYEVIVQLLDDGYNPDGDATVLPLIDANSEDEFGSTYAFAEGLVNNSYYNISVRSLSTGGVYSQEIFKIVKPLTSLAAGDVKDIIAEFPESAFENIGIETDLYWTYTPDPYLPSPDQFLITFIENGIRTSETISVLPSDSLTTCESPNGEMECYAHHVQFIPYLDPIDRVVKFESIKEYTPYLIFIQTYVEDDDLTSNGTFLRVDRTPAYQLLPAVTNVVISREPSDNSIIATWENPTTLFFNNCRVTASIIDLSVPVETETIIADDIDVGKSTSYAIPGEYFAADQRYVFVITPVDIFERDGQYIQVAEQFTEADLAPRPESPSSKDSISGDGIVSLVWGVDETEENISYKIYRAPGNTIFYSASAFVEIAEVDVPISKFTDFDVTNGEYYAYLITAVNIYGNESLNPVDDNYVPSSILRGSPTVSGVLVPPENLIATTNGQDVDLAWDFTLGTFDGYEIYRSIGNNYAFERIGNASASAVSYTDEDILLVDSQEYYYLVIKYKNETTIFITDSSVAPTESIILGSVTTLNAGEQPTITDLAIELKDLQTPIELIVSEKIDEHKHEIDELGNDKRIELRSNSVAETWTTTDFQLYSTDEDISGAENYIVKVFAEVNEAYYTSTNGIPNLASIRQSQSGSPPILYTIDGDGGTITFDTPLYTLCEEPENPDPLNPTNICPVTPYSSEPAISIELLGITEVSNELVDEQIEEVNATQITSGIFSDVQTPGISHDGRIGEQLSPLKLLTQSYDNFIYSLSNVYTDDLRNRMGTAVTFYDIIDVVVDVDGELEEEEDILAATSSGIWFSDDWGNNWSQKETFPEPVHRVFQASNRKVYAITNYGVFISDGVDLGTWNKMAGLTGVKAIRGISEGDVDTETLDADIFVTTDLGVFRLNKDKPYIEDTWEQLSIFGVQSTEAYGIIYIPEEGKIFTSNELGILESSNAGATWNFVSELDVTIKVIRFLRSDNYIFALTNDKVYRKEIGVVGFVEIASISEATISRQIEIYDGSIYVTTDDGVKVSVSDDIYSDTDIEFSALWSNINEKGVNTVITSLNVLSTSLFVGRDRKLFVFDGEELWLQFEQQGSIVPTVFVNNIEQKLGYYYNNEGGYHNIAFYEQIDYDDIVQVSNKYDIFVSPSGGWVEQKFDSKVNLWKNRIFFAESTNDIVIDQNKFVQFEFPVYDDTNANEETALAYQASMQDNLDILTGLALPEGDELRALISDTHNIYQKFISQLYLSAMVITTSNADGTESSEPLVFPEISIPLVTRVPVVEVTGDISYEEVTAGGSYNTSNGEFNFIQDFEKGDILEIDVVGSTVKDAGDLSHREVEDILELAISGLPSVLSQVSQVNNVKLGIFTETHWPGQREECSPPLQSEYIIPDVTEWYDTLNSTVNYEEEITVDDVLFAVLYPTSVLYVAEIDSIFVGGNGGVISIEVDTLEIDELDISGISLEIVKKIERHGDIIYVLTDKKIFSSDDFGSTWSEVDRAGLPNVLSSISFIQNNMIIGAEDGIYFKASEFSDWEKVLSSENTVDILSNPDVLFAVADNKIYLSSNGYSYIDLGVSVIGEITQLVKHISTIYVSTDEGLFNDTGTFYGDNPRLTQVSLEGKEDEGVNDLNSDQSDLMVGMSDGSYFQLNTEGAVLNEFSALGSIHKILLANGEVYLFGFDQMKVTDIDYPIRLTTGVPL